MTSATLAIINFGDPGWPKVLGKAAELSSKVSSPKFAFGHSQLNPKRIENVDDLIPGTGTGCRINQLSFEPPSH